MSAGLAGPGSRGDLARPTVFKWFVIIVAVGFLLRIAYAGHFYEDDGLWFTAGEEILRGKALYRDIYFDKPPGLALVYALLFRIFGAHLLTIRLFTIAYSAAISAVLYLFGARLYDKRVGVTAAAMFAVFSTTYVTGHVQSLNTELLMALPYTAGAYLMVRSVLDRSRQAVLALAGGALAGVAFHINPKAILDLVFFAVLLIASRRWAVSEDDKPSHHRSRWRLFALAIVGFAAVWLLLLVYLSASSSLREYWFYVWDWGARYGSYYGAGKMLLTALPRSADYFLLNNTLLIALVFLIVTTVRSCGRFTAEHATDDRLTTRLQLQSDVMLLTWFAASYAGVMAGGRFFGHYFIQIMPALCLIGARSFSAMLPALRGRSPAFRRSAIAVIAIGFALTLVRFHTRGFLLMLDSARGSVSERNAHWYYNELAREERMAAAVVRDLPDGPDAADRVGLEAMRDGGPRTRPAEGSADYLFVWGYRPEIYFWSGLIPASGFLSTQPLTGVPADVHYFGSDYRPLLGDEITAEARERLARDLEETKPKYIVDEIGFFNADLAILKYSELRDVMSSYKPIGETGRFLIYIRKELTKKYRQRLQYRER